LTLRGFEADPFVIVADADVAPAPERLFGEFASTIGEED
jgi:hypothetical protein